eukprot:Nk52_evm52s485 gene=Nk52_evmTU52s485
MQRWNERWINNNGGALNTKRHSSSSSSSVEECEYEWVPFIGLEIHAQILSKTKIFSPAPAAVSCNNNNNNNNNQQEYHKTSGSNNDASLSSSLSILQPNVNISFLCAALPGSLPVLNARCRDAAILTALALNCRINRTSTFDRKHYFYPDMPAGFQITQQRVPLASDGHVLFEDLNEEWMRVDSEDEGREGRKINVTTLHIEQDSGKSTHDVHPDGDKSLIDLNRCGTGLMEIVTAPDLHSGAEAALFVKHVRRLVRALGTCDGNMAEGSMRVDANVSVARKRKGHRVKRMPLEAGEKEDFGQRVEIKNVNGTRFLEKAIDYEIQRQIEVLESGGSGEGGKIKFETRYYDPVSRTTRSLRSKESVKDYRYMPEPDLPLLVVSEEHVQSIRKGIPELPHQTARRLLTHPSSSQSVMKKKRGYGLKPAQCQQLLDIPGGVEFFEQTVLKEADGEIVVRPVVAANWILVNLLGRINREQSMEASSSSPLAGEGTDYGHIHQSFVQMESASSGAPVGGDGRFEESENLLEASPVSPDQLRSLLELVAPFEGQGEARITSQDAKNVFEEMFKSSIPTRGASTEARPNKPSAMARDILKKLNIVELTTVDKDGNDPVSKKLEALCRSKLLEAASDSGNQGGNEGKKKNKKKSVRLELTNDFVFGQEKGKRLLSSLVGQVMRELSGGGKKKKGGDKTSGSAVAVPPQKVTECMERVVREMIEKETAGS